MTIRAFKTFRFGPIHVTMSGARVSTAIGG
jgi:hypothetical protein